jgi:hypothetical protein
MPVAAEASIAITTPFAETVVRSKKATGAGPNGASKVWSQLDGFGDELAA